MKAPIVAEKNYRQIKRTNRSVGVLGVVCARKRYRQKLLHMLLRQIHPLFLPSHTGIETRSLDEAFHCSNRKESPQCCYSFLLVICRRWKRFGVQKKSFSKKKTNFVSFVSITSPYSPGACHLIFTELFFSRVPWGGWWVWRVVRWDL